MRKTAGADLPSGQGVAVRDYRRGNVPLDRCLSVQSADRHVIISASAVTARQARCESRHRRPDPRAAPPLQRPQPPPGHQTPRRPPRQPQPPTAPPPAATSSALHVRLRLHPSVQPSSSQRPRRRTARPLLPDEAPLLIPGDLGFLKNSAARCKQRLVFHVGFRRPAALQAGNPNGQACSRSSLVFSARRRHSASALPTPSPCPHAEPASPRSLLPAHASARTWPPSRPALAPICMCHYVLPGFMASMAGVDSMTVLDTMAGAGEEPFAAQAPARRLPGPRGHPPHGLRRGRARRPRATAPYREPSLGVRGSLAAGGGPRRQASPAWEAGRPRALAVGGLGACGWSGRASSVRSVLLCPVPSA
ncbi:hypothetical protein PVAP13_1KG254905 [Panicum virgatum]|uniref:Uncharacterized protein n=1 Tax=Panicum virgatum TaxID=38727 RepID=A0A8T0XAE6_PANVG|nr:hypothetical protein PVAP13_1KG254905 [Panicum virgatum]